MSQDVIGCGASKTLIAELVAAEPIAALVAALIAVLLRNGARKALVKPAVGRVVKQPRTSRF